MAVVKSPKNKKHKKEWVKLINQKKFSNINYSSLMFKKSIYTNLKLNSSFQKHFKKNSQVLWFL